MGSKLTKRTLMDHPPKIGNPLRKHAVVAVTLTDAIAFCRSLVTGVALCLAVLVTLLSNSTILAAASSVVTNFNDFYNRPLQSGEGQRLFRIPAVVTYADPEWKILFLQDGARGCSVPPSFQPSGVGPGDMVLVQGSQSALPAARDALWLSDTDIRPLGRGELPKPVPVDAAGLFATENAFRRMEAKGTVRAVYDYGRLRLTVVIDKQRFAVWVGRHRPADLDHLRDAQVTIRGVCNHRPEPDGKLGVDILTSDFRSLQIDRAGPADSFGAKLIAISDILTSPPANEPQRVHVKGAVLEQKRGESLLIRDATGQLLIRTLQRLSLAKEDVVEVIGFPVDMAGKRVLEDAEFRVVEASRARDVTAAQADPALPVLTSIKSVLDLNREQARHHYPVKLRGVVTCCNLTLEAVFLQDGDDGIYVELGSLKVNLKAGHVVELQGYTLPGGVLSMLAPIKIDILGETNLPAAKPMTFQDGSTGAYDSRRVEIRGAVQSVGKDEENFLLDILGTDGRFRSCWMPRLPGYTLPSNLSNSVVLVRGVCMVDVSPLGRFQGLSLAIASTNDLEILKPAPEDPFELPTQGIGDVERFLPPNVATRLIKVRGVVTLSRPGRAMYVQDSTGGILVQTYLTNRVEVGDQVEVIGFRAQGKFTPVLQYATFAVVRSKVPMPDPAALPAAVVLAGTNNMLVQIEARLLDDVPATFAPEFHLGDGQVLFTAAIEPSQSMRRYPSYRAGSLLRVTGIADLRGDDETERPNSLRLLMRDQTDVKVLRKPTWFTAKRMYTLAGLLVLAGAASMGWVVALRRRVRQQTKLIRQRLGREASLEARYRELVENANDIILAFDRSGQILSINRAGERTLGYSRSTALEMKLQQIVVPEHRAQLQSLLSGSAEPQTMMGIHELGVLTKDGRVLTLELSTRWLGSEAGVARFESIARDVTERKNAEERLRASEAQLAEAQRIGHLGSWDFTVSSRSLKLSAEALRLLDQPADTALPPRAVLSFLSPTERHGFRTALKEAIRNGGAFDMDCRLVLPRGRERIVHTRVETGSDATGNCARVFGTFQDMTERRDLETQLRQAQKMEALGTLAGGIAHDFNNILAAAIGYLELVRMDAKDRPEILENLDEVDKANNRATDLVRQILAFSRRGRQQRQPLHLQRVVTECLKLLRSTLPAGIQIDTHLQPEPLMVLGDPTQIHQVMMNLCANAAHAIGGKPGTLTLRLAAFEVNAEFARTHPDLKVGQYARLVVADTGHGMSGEVLARIYDPFFTTKGPGEGTGLGLSVVHGIVKDHSGAIQVTSVVGSGTTFDIFFPIADASATGVQAPSPAVAPGHGERILFVDDEPALCQTASKLLRSWGYQVTFYTQPTEAIRQFQAQPQAFDLVVTDLSMPGLSGLDLAVELHKIRPEMPIILSSGYVEEWTPDWAQKKGIKELLLKPVAPIDLRAAVGRVLRSQA